MGQDAPISGGACILVITLAYLEVGILSLIAKKGAGGSAAIIGDGAKETFESWWSLVFIVLCSSLQQSFSPSLLVMPHCPHMSSSLWMNDEPTNLSMQ
jgi:hypothetical protein